jgi:hypothetical protein
VKRAKAVPHDQQLRQTRQKRASPGNEMQQDIYTEPADVDAGAIVAELPDLEEADVRQALAYAAALARDELHTLRT